MGFPVRPVAGLFLWQIGRQTPEGGGKISRLPITTSLILECIAARWTGLEVCGVSLVTNAAAGYTGEPLTHEEVLESGAEVGPRKVQKYVMKK